MMVTELLLNELDQAAIDSAVNRMLVPVEVFARISCLESAIFGIQTLCEDCEFPPNVCLRSQLVRQLLTAQTLAEKELGFDLSPTYHTVEIDWTGRYLRLQLPHPAVEKLNVSGHAYAAIPDYGPFPISPYVMDGVTFQDSGQQFCLAVLDGTLFDNPERALVRDVTGQVYAKDKRSGYPRRDINGDWLLPVQSVVPPCAVGEDFVVQHCDYMVLDVPPPVSVCEGEIVPVYPGTTQVIPQAKPRQTLPGGDWRYWFWTASLVNPAFFDSGLIDLANNQVYKLLETIEFRCRTEVEAPAVALCYDAGCCGEEEDFPTPTEIPVTVRLMNKPRGIIEVRDCYDCGPCTDGRQLLKLRVSYLTRPETLSPTPDLGTLAEGIAFLAAAELPLESCGCEITTGFIHTAQKPFHDIRINPITGEAIVMPKYGNLYGHLAFDDRVSRVRKRRKHFRM